MENDSEVKADVIEVTVKGGFNTIHTFHTTAGVLGSLNLKTMKGEGLFRGADGSELHIRKTSFWRTNYALTEGGVNLGSARAYKSFSRVFELQYLGEYLQLAPDRSKMRSWKLSDRVGNTVCTLKPRGALKRGGLIRVISSAELKLLVFTYCLVTRRWQEESSAA